MSSAPMQHALTSAAPQPCKMNRITRTMPYPHGAIPGQPEQGWTRFFTECGGTEHPPQRVVSISCLFLNAI